MQHDREDGAEAQSPMLGNLLRANLTSTPNRSVYVVHHIHSMATTTTAAPTPNVSQANKTNCTVISNPNTEPFLWWGASSEIGEPCVFGVDKRDEGTHCIDIGGSEFGSFGWCYTDEDKSSWGSCSEGCPLSGSLHKIGDMLEERKAEHGELQKRLDAVMEMVNTTSTTLPPTTQAPAANESVAPAAVANQGAGGEAPAGAAAEAPAEPPAEAPKEEEGKKKKKGL